MGAAMNLGRKLAGWNITAQIGLIVAVLLVPLVLMTGMLVASQNEGISFAHPTQVVVSQ